MLIVGGALVAIGAFLPWVSRSGVSLNGFDDFVYAGDGEIQVFEGPGVMSLLGGAIGLGLGIALVVAGRVLAVAIVATVFASIGILFGIFLVMIANDKSMGGNIKVIEIGRIRFMSGLLNPMFRIPVAGLLAPPCWQM